MSVTPTIAKKKMPRVGLPKQADERMRFVTHTFSECVENHAGMQTIGAKRQHGFTEEQLAAIADANPDTTTLHTLAHSGERAAVLVMHDGVDLLLGKGEADKLLEESKGQAFDEKFLNTRRKKVQSKHGRFNNCYADTPQDPDIEKGKGTVISFDSAPKMAALRAALPTKFGPDAANLFAETNDYYNIAKPQVGIGFHGDTERSIVIGVRLGAASLPLRFQWYHRSKAVSDEYAIALNHGDVYVMSNKATGYDWLCPSKTTLRHGVGRKAKPKAIGE